MSTVTSAPVDMDKLTEEWFEKLRTTDACVTPVRTVAEVAQDLPERFTRAPVPQLGEHTTEILAQLKRSGAIP